MLCPGRGGQTLGYFALVAYLPDPLARFLDDLRIELIPDCKPRAHVTILPPRPLYQDLKETVRQIADKSRGIPPFQIEIGTTAIFDTSNVVYLGLSRGSRELYELYRTLNSGRLRYEEPFKYHPHITIAQNIDREEAERVAAVTKRRWSAWDGPREFLACEMTFVQNVAPDAWLDVAQLPLTADVPVAT